MVKRCVCCNYRYQTSSDVFYTASTASVEELNAYCELRNLEREEPRPVLVRIESNSGDLCNRCYRAIKEIRKHPRLDDTPDLTIWRDAPSSHTVCLFACGARSENLTRITKTPAFWRKLLVEYQVCHKFQGVQTAPY